MNRQSIRFSISFFVLICIFFGSEVRTSFAQSNIRIFHVQDKESRGDAPYLGRDLWFAIPQNASPNNHSQKYFNIYVTSPRNTTVNFQVGKGKITKKPVTAGKVTVFTSPTPKFPGGDISVSTEITSSGVVETEKAIHIWSDNADIAVYFLSRVPYTSDGMYVLPSIGWGKEYVVGAYSSLLVPQNLADYPSEFVVVANQDNTTITIIPSYDLRKDGVPNVPDHKKGIPFTQNLNKGECIQYQVTGAATGDEDATGTIITSNNPIGVMGASVCPFINPSDPYCDYILDMLQPVRSWSKTYYTAPFAGRKYGGDVFLLVGSKDGQIVYQNGSPVSLSRYQAYFQDVVINPTLWSSTEPFMLVQYVPSATHGVPQNQQRNLGDPAMVVINPAEQFNKKVIFQTPTIDLASGQKNFTNYVNILLPAAHESKTTYDGKPISLTPAGVQKVDKYVIPGTAPAWEALRFTYNPGVGEGTHTIVSDTGVGVYIYGYGVDDSYAWAGALGSKSPNDPDTIPPVAIADGACFCAHVRISDTGPGQSRLSSFIEDTLDNMTYIPDRDFIPGGGLDSSYYDMCVIDSSKEAYLSVSIYDIAGNRTTVISHYLPQLVRISPSSLNFGTVNVGNTGFRYDTICNTGDTTFNFRKANLALLNGKIGFTIDSVGADGFLPVGGCRVVKIKFTSIVPPTVKDTLQILDECLTIHSVIIGNGGLPDFDVPDYTWDCTPLKSVRPSQNYFLSNPSGIDIKADTLWIDDKVNFGYDYQNPAGNKLPILIPNSNTLAGKAEIVVTFSPQSVGLITTKIHVVAKGVEKTATISGYGCAPEITSKIGNTTTSCDIPAAFKIPIIDTGTYYDSIISVKGVPTAGAKGFGPVKVEDVNGNPITLPYHLNVGDSIFATVFYTPQPKSSGCFTDTIIVTRFGGEIATQTYVTVCVEYRELTVTQAANFGTLSFGSVKAQSYFEVCNTGADPVTISSLSQLSPPGATGFALANLLKVNGVTVTLPVTIALNECLKVYVDFDPSFANAIDQLDSFDISSNACVPYDHLLGKAMGATSTGPPDILGFAHPAIFSCGAAPDSVTYTNINNVAGEITAVKIGGTDAGNFKYIGALPVTVPPKTTIALPIAFTPNSQGGTQPYSATVTVTFDDKAGKIIDKIANVSATGQGIDLSITSQFSTPVAHTGDYVTLPIDLTVDKHGLDKLPSIFSLTQVDIRRIELTYTYDMNLLDITKDNIAAAVKLNLAGWSVDIPNSKVDRATNTLQIALMGPALTDADLLKSIGTIEFRAMLPKAGTATDVRLASIFKDGSSQQIANCMSVSKKDSTFSLIYSCGDTTLQKFLNGQLPMSAFPVNPNPAGSHNGRILSFKYAVKFDGVIALAIYDELGKEVARVINNQALPAGAYEVRYNSAALAEGTYVYSYSLNNKSVTSGRFVIQK